MSTPQPPPDAAPKKYRRRKKLIQPRLQLKLTMVTALTVVTATLLQFLLFSRAIATLASKLPNDSLVLLELGQSSLIQCLVITLVALLPISMAAGILSTFRVAGPVYRLERYLEQVIDGQRPADCRLRKGDELKDLCERVNEATRPLREEPANDLPASDVPATDVEVPSQRRSA
ncbi:MAG: hypothetical protein AAFZ65_16975 [Planctomycetota bacterium]